MGLIPAATFNVINLHVMKTEVQQRNFCMIYTAIMSLVGLLVRTLILGEIKPAISREMAAMQNLGFCCLGKKNIEDPTSSFTLLESRGKKGPGETIFRHSNWIHFPSGYNRHTIIESTWAVANNPPATFQQILVGENRDACCLAYLKTTHISLGSIIPDIKQLTRGPLITAHLMKLVILLAKFTIKNKVCCFHLTTFWTVHPGSSQIIFSCSRSPSQVMHTEFSLFFASTCWGSRLPIPSKKVEKIQGFKRRWGEQVRKLTAFESRHISNSLPNKKITHFMSTERAPPQKNPA